MSERPEEDLNSISASIGELRADNRRHTEFASSILSELRRLSERLDMVSQLGVELREYRKTLHDRFDRVNEVAAGHTLAIDKLEDRVSATENTKLIAIDRKIELLDQRWKTLIKVSAVIGSIVLTTGGWFFGNFGKQLVAMVFGGG